MFGCETPIAIMSAVNHLLLAYGTSIAIIFALSQLTFGCGTPTIITTCRFIAHANNLATKM
jgi:hypothetical protein